MLQKGDTVRNNLLNIAGTLTGAPVTYTSRSGEPVTEAVVLVNRRTRNAFGAIIQAPPTRYVVRAWGTTAQQLGMVPAGSGMIVFGQLQTETWADETGRHFKDVVDIDQVGVTLTTHFESTADAVRWSESPDLLTTPGEADAAIAGAVGSDSRSYPVRADDVDLSDPGFTASRTAIESPGFADPGDDM
jgi:single-stranded DNA-binding protein